MKAFGALNIYAATFGEIDPLSVVCNATLRARLTENVTDFSKYFIF